MIEENKEDNSDFSSSKKEEMEREMVELKEGLQKLTTAYDYLFKELKKVQEKNDQLEEGQELLREEIFQLRSSSLTNDINRKEKRLNKFVSSIKSRLKEDDLLEELLEAQKEFTLSKSSFAAKQLEKYKKKLVKNGVREEEVKKLCETKDGLTKLEKEIEQQQFEARVEINK
jgi:hypothetical protein